MFTSKLQLKKELVKWKVGQKKLSTNKQKKGQYRKFREECGDDRALSEQVEHTHGAG